MKLTKISLALMACGPLSMIHAAGIDRSGQPMDALFQQGTYAEASYAQLMPDVSGRDFSGNVVPDMAADYNISRYGVKHDISDSLRIAVLYDEPFGAAAKFEGNNNFVSGAGDTITALGNTIPLSVLGSTGATEVSVDTQNISGIVGISPIDNIMLYGGVAGQQIDGNVHLRGKTYGGLSGYDMSISDQIEYGYIAGAAYSIPSIALRAAVTYRSQIDYDDLHVGESLPILALSPQLTQATGGLTSSGGSDIEIMTPESVNIDFQTGVAPKTLLTAKLRWVPWSEFKIRPTRLTAVALVANQGDYSKSMLVGYDEDQISGEIGLARRLSDRLAVSTGVSYDTGAGNPVSSLGPVEGYWGAALGGKFNVTDEMAVSLGARYLWLGDSKAKLSSDTIVGDFKDNTAVIVGGKLSYQY